MFISPEHGRALLCAGNSDGMDEAIESIFFCWEACQDEPESGFISSQRQPQERGRSRTRRMNINSSFDSGSTRTRRKIDNFDDGIATKDVERKIYLKKTSSFTLEADEINEKEIMAKNPEKSGKKDPEDTVGDTRKRERQRRRRQRMNARMQRRARKNGVRPVNSNAEMTVEINENNHPKDWMKNSRKESSSNHRRLESIPVSTTTQDTRQGDGHSKAKVGPANKNKQLSSQKGGHQIPTERSTTEVTKSQQRQKSPQKLRKMFQSMTNSLRKERTIGMNSERTERTIGINSQRKERTFGMYSLRKERTIDMNSEQKERTFGMNSLRKERTIGSLRKQRTIEVLEEAESRDDQDITVRKTNTRSARGSSESTTTRTTYASDDTREQNERNNINDMETSRQENFKKLLKKFSYVPPNKSHGRRNFLGRMTNSQRMERSIFPKNSMRKERSIGMNSQRTERSIFPKNSMRKERSIGMNSQRTERSIFTKNSMRKERSIGMNSQRTERSIFTKNSMRKERSIGITRNNE